MASNSQIQQSPHHPYYHNQEHQPHHHHYQSQVPFMQCTPHQQHWAMENSSSQLETVNLYQNNQEHSSFAHQHQVNHQQQDPANQMIIAAQQFPSSAQLYSQLGNHTFAFNQQNIDLAAQQQQQQQYHNYSDAGYLVDTSNQRNTIKQQHARSGNKQIFQEDEHQFTTSNESNVLTELSRSKKVLPRIELVVSTGDELDLESTIKKANKIEQNSLKKKKKTNNKSQEVKICPQEEYEQNNQNSNGREKDDGIHSSSSLVYLQNVHQQRPQALNNGKTFAEVDYRWQETDTPTASHRSSSSGGLSSSYTLNRQPLVEERNIATTTLDDSNTINEYSAHQAYPPPQIVDSSSNNDSSRHNLHHHPTISSSCYTATANSYQALVSNEEDENCKLSPSRKQNPSTEFNQLRILEMRKEKSRDAARSRRSKENHEFYELAKLLPLPAAITSQLDFLDKASIIRLTISFLKLRQFSVNGHPPWAPDFTTLGSINPYSSQALVSNYTSNEQQHCGHNASQQDEQSGAIENVMINNQLKQHLNTTPSSVSFSQDSYHHRRSDSMIVEKSSLNKSSTASLFDIHQGTHILQSLDGFAFAIGRDGRFLYISETVSMYLGLSQVEMTGSSVFDYTHQQDHEELARQLGIPYTLTEECGQNQELNNNTESPPPTSVHSQYSAASNETLIDDYMNNTTSTSSRATKRAKVSGGLGGRGAYRNGKRSCTGTIKQQAVKIESSNSDKKTLIQTDLNIISENKVDLKSSQDQADASYSQPKGTDDDPLVRQFCIRMKSTLTKRGCQHFKSSGYRVVHVIAHLRSYQSNDHGHLMDPLDEAGYNTGSSNAKHSKKRASKASSKSQLDNKDVQQQQVIAIKEGSDLNTSGEQRSQTAVHQKIIGLVAVAIALPPPSINELRLESDTFVLRLGLDLKVTHIEPKITELLQYPVEMIAGRSLYSLVHPADVFQLQKCHKDLLKKGQMMSNYYRILARNGGYIWIQTCATLICNNTPISSGQVLPSATSSPMPAPHTSLHHHHHHHQQQQQHHHHHHHQHNQNIVNNTGDHLHKLNNYLTSPTIDNKQLMLSPGLNSGSSLNSNYNDQFDQDQCVIFVNYMITDVIDSNDIVDLCQSSNYTNAASSSSSSANNNTTSTSFSGNNSVNLLLHQQQFNSPTSSCTSPCSKGNNSNNTSSFAGSYIVSNSSTPNNSLNLSSSSSSPRQRNSHHSESNKSREIKLTPIRRTTSKTKSNIFMNSSGDENNLNNSGQFNVSGSSSSGGANLINQQKNLVDTNSVYSDSISNLSLPPNTSTGASPIYAHCYNSQTTGGVNLALNKNENSSSNWLSTHHQTQASPSYGSANTALNGGSNINQTDHYSSMNRSIYKAAFGLDVSTAAAVGYNHQQVYPTVGSAAAAAVAAAANYPNQPVAAANVAPNSWDTVAAVAAASSHLNNHHHHHQQHLSTNPYTHLDSHNHHHQHHQTAHTLGSAAAAAAAAATNNHTSAGSYYNYYGYYGNKFI